MAGRARARGELNSQAVVDRWELRLKEFRWPVRVYYEDTDSGGVVYYANYFRFMERARSERLRELGFEQDCLRAEHGILFTVHSVQAEFLRPAVFNDVLQVTADITSQRRVSLTFSQQIYRRDESAPLCRASVRIACVSADSFRPCAIPEPVRRELADVG